MKKPSKKWFALMVSTAIFACATSSYIANANTMTYNDSNVSITSAVDRYIAYNGDAFEEATSTDATESAATATQKMEETGCKYPEFEGKALVIINDNVNIRAEANAESEKVGSIGPAGIMLVEEKGSEWSYIASGNCEGYIKNEFIAFGDEAGEFAEANLPRMATINASSLRVRESGDENSKCLTLVPGGEKYLVLDEGNEWTKIEVDDSVSGYVKNEYIEISYNTVRAVTVEEENARRQQAATTTESTETQTTEAQADSDTTEAATEATTEATTEAPAAPTGSTGADVAAYAVQFVGNPYVYGGSSLTNGTDCSGFTMSVYAAFGYSLPHSSSAQANCGVEVALTELVPGDLVFYTNGTSTIGHVALYIGNGQVVHASTSTTGIIISNTNYSTPCKAVRIIN